MIKTINSLIFYCLDLSIREDNGDVNQSYTACLQAITNLLISKARQTTPYWFPFFFQTAYSKYIVQEMSN